MPRSREATVWRFRRAVARVEPAVTPVLVEHATTLVVHDFSLLDPLRKALRTRHVSIRLAA